MHARPNAASILVACKASRTWGLALQIQLSLAQAFNGMRGASRPRGPEGNSNSSTRKLLAVAVCSDMHQAE